MINMCSGLRERVVSAAKGVEPVCEPYVESPPSILRAWSSTLARKSSSLKSSANQRARTATDWARPSSGMGKIFGSATNVLAADGHAVEHDDLATITPYITRTIRRFGDWVLNFTS